jgi:hypothetical protein
LQTKAVLQRSAATLESPETAFKYGGARAFIAVPMLKENKLVGAINIFRQEELVSRVEPSLLDKAGIEGWKQRLISCIGAGHWAGHLICGPSQALSGVSAGRQCHHPQEGWHRLRARHIKAHHRDAR